MQDFTWCAEYADGTHLVEIEESGKAHLFKEIQKDKLIAFGLAGRGMSLYYDVSTGIFNLAGRIVELAYRVGEKEYPLTGQTKLYNDCISFKQAYTEISPLTCRRSNTRIVQYCFGYKVRLQLGDLELHFKPVVFIPYDRPVYATFRLVADRDIADGELVIRRNGQTMEQIPVPLQKGVGLEAMWEVR
ncbi:hypothetical protein [Desulfocucumis palustris]|nr:hypothetical protein [Desulfocucumis palustris]